ncbi:hypothetical protein ACI2L1_45040, partial [Streptomyces sp. NPDC019531]|uniref:hypothetical protein n=1 Tax=Streptomyces sp. NPDC019531 TaxID=3365062 RepID=UPI00384BABEC
AANQWNSPSAPEAVPGLESQVPSEDRNDDPAEDPAAPAHRFPFYRTYDWGERMGERWARGAGRRWGERSEHYEEAVGWVLAADPRVIAEAGKAVEALYFYMVDHYGEGGMRAAFHRPEMTGRAFLRLLVDRSDISDVPLGLLMTVFADLAYENYENQSPAPSLRALWQDRPELNTQDLKPPTSETHSDSFLQEARERGLRMTQGPATLVEWLLGVHRMVVPDGDALLFREAMLGWLLPSGRHSLAEILAAAQDVGVRDHGEPDISRVDAARLHGWVNGALDPLARERSLASVEEITLRSSETEFYEPPHHPIYLLWTKLAAIRSAREDPQVIHFLDLIRKADSTSRPDAPAFEASEEASEEWRHRCASLAEWLHRHQDIALLRDNLNNAHAMAVYLVSGVDARLIEALDSTKAGERLSHEARALLMAAAVGGDSPFPLLFLREAEQWADSWGQNLRYELPLTYEFRLHGELAAEALEMLPPVDTRVYWTSVPDSAAGGGVPGAGTKRTWSRFHRATTSAEAALGELRGLAGGQGLPVMWSVERATARDVSPLSRTPQLRTVLYPSRTKFRVESAGLFHDVVTGRAFLRVELSELPAGQPVEPWDQPIVTRDLASGGRWVGVASFDARYWAQAGKAVERTRELAAWWPVNAYHVGVGAPEPLNWDGDWFVAATAHGSPHSVSVVSRYGPRKISGAEWGRYLKALLDRGGLPAQTRIFLSSSSAGAEVPGGDSVGQQVADWTGRRTTAPTARILVTRPTGQPYMGLVAEAGQKPPRLVEFTPRDLTRAATARPGDPGFPEYADGFRAFYSDPAWERLSREYEQDLGEDMAADPDVQRAAWHLVDVLGRKYRTVIEDRLTRDADPAEVRDAAQRVLEVLRRNTAADGTPDRATDDLEVWELLLVLYHVVAEAALRDGMPVRTSSSGPAWRPALRGGHGFSLANDRNGVVMRLLEDYRDLAPARMLPAARAALIALMLGSEQDSLYEMLADSHKVARFPAAERVVLLQDAAHL